MKEDSISNIQEQIDMVKASIDSINRSKILDEVKYRAVEQVDVIESVRAYYDDSFNHLLWLIGFIVTLVTITVPIISGYYQRKNLQDFAGKIKSELETQFNFKISELEKIYNAEIQSINEQFNKKSKELEVANRAQLSSHFFFAKGSVFQSFQQWDPALEHYFLAAINWIQLKDNANLMAVLKGIGECLNEINNDDLASLEKRLKSKLKKDTTIRNIISMVENLSNEEIKFNDNFIMLKQRFLQIENRIYQIK